MCSQCLQVLESCLADGGIREVEHPEIRQPVHSYQSGIVDTRSLKIQLSQARKVFQVRQTGVPDLAPGENEDFE